MRRLWWLVGKVKEIERKIGNDSVGLLHSGPCPSRKYVIKLRGWPKIKVSKKSLALSTDFLT